MVTLTKTASQVFASTDGSGNARGADMAEAATWGTEIETALTTEVNDFDGIIRNHLLNPAMDHAQRSTSTAISAGSNDFVLDRWKITNGTDQSVTVSQQSFALGHGLTPGRNRRKMRFAFASAPTTGTLRIAQRIRGVDSVDAVLATLTAYMTGPSGTETLAAEIVQNFGTGGSPSTAVTTAMSFATDSPTAIYDASSWRRDWTVTVPSLSGKTLGTSGDYLEVAIVMTPRQSGNYEITRISFAPGDLTGETDPAGGYDPDTDFCACQRYYCVTRADARGYAAAASAIIQDVVYWPVEMIGTPTAAITGSSKNNVTSENLIQANKYGVRLSLAATGTGDCYSVDGIVRANAEI